MDASGSVCVLIVDDQAPFRGAARAVVGATKEFSVVGEAESGEEAVELVASLEPDLVLMDINMGGIDGIEATRQIRAANPETMVVLVSTYAATDLAADARTCGAAAYVHKEELAPRVLRELWSTKGDAEWRRGADGEDAD
ncbi:MAG TPA: response regulator transcription factor [Acidimicrobiales bacterium]|nr:response regulator transcription factor [Acidimicrobiales bacterium]